ncbi:hypothetical protein QQF64_005681 [Cirrhinus molitorella]|uniref:Uncharacterized protein n=1 Tax=Cirrhinus molitorella TaxID=172907 RepID=A0ABR3MD01_9TELE
MYSCAHVYVSLGGLSGVRAFRLATRSKYRGLTFLSSVSAERDKSGLPAALAASRYLVTFQTVGVGGLSQARPGWEGNQGQQRLDCVQEACKWTGEMPSILTHFHGKGKVTWLQKCPGTRLGGL